MNIATLSLHYYSMYKSYSNVYVLVAYCCRLCCVGEGGHSEVYRVSGQANGSHWLCELQWDATRRLPHHHLDDGTQELRCQKGEGFPSALRKHSFFQPTTKALAIHHNCPAVITHTNRQLYSVVTQRYWVAESAFNETEPGFSIYIYIYLDISQHSLKPRTFLHS